MRLLLATNNAHKVLEIRAIRPDWAILTPRDLGIAFHHDETGDTFAANALGKAEALWRLLPAAERDAGTQVLADDSGLVVPALGGDPGVRSARYGDEPGRAPLDDRGRCELLIERMRAVAERAAHFVCCLALVRGDDRFACFQETFEGSIATVPMDGGGGFGYDPVFWLPDYQTTVACLPPGEKNRISHRAKALAALAAWLDTQT